MTPATTVHRPSKPAATPSEPALLGQIKREIVQDSYYKGHFPNDGQRFLAWYLRRVLLRNDAAAKDDITDGPDDKWIDA